MASQSDVLRIIDFLEFIGLDYEQIVYSIRFLEGRGTLEDLSDLRDIVKQD